MNYENMTDKELSELVFRRAHPYTPNEALELGRAAMIEILEEDDGFYATEDEEFLVVDEGKHSKIDFTQIRLGSKCKICWMYDGKHLEASGYAISRSKDILHLDHCDDGESYIFISGQDEILSVIPCMETDQ